MILIIVVILLILALGGMPAWPYAASWGWGPSGVVVAILVVVLIVWAVRGSL